MSVAGLKAGEGTVPQCSEVISAAQIKSTSLNCSLCDSYSLWPACISHTIPLLQQMDTHTHTHGHKAMHTPWSDLYPTLHANTHVYARAHTDTHTHSVSQNNEGRHAERRTKLVTSWLCWWKVTETHLPYKTSFDRPDVNLLHSTRDADCSRRLQTNTTSVWDWNFTTDVSSSSSVHDNNTVLTEVITETCEQILSDSLNVHCGARFPTLVHSCANPGATWTPKRKKEIITQSI